MEIIQDDAGCKGEGRLSGEERCEVCSSDSGEPDDLLVCKEDGNGGTKVLGEFCVGEEVLEFDFVLGTEGTHAVSVLPSADFQDRRHFGKRKAFDCDGVGWWFACGQEVVSCTDTRLFAPVPGKGGKCGRFRAVEAQTIGGDGDGGGIVQGD